MNNSKSPTFKSKQSTDFDNELLRFHAELSAVFGDVGLPSFSLPNALESLPEDNNGYIDIESHEAIATHGATHEGLDETPEPLPRAQHGKAGSGFGGEADIDLYIGHLRTIGSSLREQFSKPLEGFYHLISLDSYGKGCSDGTITKHELPLLKSKSDRVKISKSRSDMSDDDLKKSFVRAKKELRKKTIMLKPSSMLTLTWANEIYDRNVAYSDLNKFVRMMKDRFGKFDYVAVLERHKKGDYHFHLAVNKGYHWNTVRYIWRKANGTGKGNIDFTKKRFMGRDNSVKTAIRIAGYMTKYFTKDDISEIGQKRYSTSRGIPKPRKEKYYIPVSQYTFELAEALIKEVTGENIKRVFDVPDSTIPIRWISTY